ncbi:MAG TPA: hypothetical protein VIM69_12645, partial [Opitutaceae bacterium]
ATLLPLAIALPAIWFIISRATTPLKRCALAVVLVPMIVTTLLAWQQLRAWSTVDAMAISLAVACLRVVSAKAARPWLVGLLGPAVIAGLCCVWPQRMPANRAEFPFTRAEIEGLYERELAQWIADHAGPTGATVLTPPFRTSAFSFYGGLRGLGTPNWENRDGVTAEFHIINSTKPEESQALIEDRGISYITVLSWDDDFDTFAKIGLQRPSDSFIYALHKTDGGIFPWLKAVPYSPPEVSGFGNASVLLLKVVDEANQAVMRSRLVEYLLEMHHLDQAAFAGKALSKYPSDLGALVTLAELEKAQNDDEAFKKVFASLQSNLASGSDRNMPWDRRVSLAVALALGGRVDLSEVQVRHCVEQIDADKIRDLTTGSLYHLLYLCSQYGVEIKDPELRALALKLLPAELRGRL